MNLELYEVISALSHGSEMSHASFVIVILNHSKVSPNNCASRIDMFAHAF